MLTLDLLARELPTSEQLERYLELIADESDRGTVLMSAALVERALEDALRRRLVDPGDGTAEEWFGGMNAPFRSFSAKISLGRAVGLYDAEFQAKLTILRKIRNAFAHRVLPLDFSHPTVFAEYSKLPPAGADDAPGKIVYIGTCVLIARILGMEAVALAHFGPMDFESGE